MKYYLFIKLLKLFGSPPGVEVSGWELSMEAGTVCQSEEDTLTVVFAEDP